VLSSPFWRVVCGLRIERVDATGNSVSYVCLELSHRPRMTWGLPFRASRSRPPACMALQRSRGWPVQLSRTNVPRNDRAARMATGERSHRARLESTCFCGAAGAGGLQRYRRRSRHRQEDWQIIAALQRQLIMSACFAPNYLLGRMRRPAMSCRFYSRCHPAACGRGSHPSICDAAAVGGDPPLTTSARSTVLQPCVTPRSTLPSPAVAVIIATAGAFGWRLLSAAIAQPVCHMHGSMCGMGWKASGVPPELPAPLQM